MKENRYYKIYIRDPVERQNKPFKIIDEFYSSISSIPIILVGYIYLSNLELYWLSFSIMLAGFFSLISHVYICRLFQYLDYLGILLCILSSIYYYDVLFTIFCYKYGEISSCVLIVIFYIWFDLVTRGINYYNEDCNYIHAFWHLSVATLAFSILK